MRLETLTLKSARSLSLLAAAVILSACSSGERPATQVAVKINSGEVSIHQVNAQLGRMQNVPAEQHDAVRKRVVEALIDQQLLIEQAMEAKLDRDPEVLAAIEQSRSQILAQSYVRKTLGTKARPSDEEIKAYYQENPELFASRRIFRLEELGTDMPVERAEELRRVVAGAKSMGEVAQWLQKNQFKLTANVAVRGAEQLPLAQLKTIHALKDGDKVVLESQQRLTVLHLLASQQQPVTEEQAQPLIEQFLGGRRRDELARDELARLRGSAKIEYLGEFSKLASLDPAKAAAPGGTVGEAPVPAGTAPAGAALLQESQASAPAAPSVEVIDKGLAGLR